MRCTAWCANVQQTAHLGYDNSSLAPARWTTAPPSLRVTLWMLLADLPPMAPLMLLATADVPLSELDPDAAGH